MNPLVDFFCFQLYFVTCYGVSAALLSNYGDLQGKVSGMDMSIEIELEATHCMP
jgi:hypothetical protein